MQALICTGIAELELQDVAPPIAGEGEVLIKLAASGICGSDMHAYLGHDARRPVPIILGHESAGHIVGGLRDGERVTINPLTGCGRCPACRFGKNNICPERQIQSMPPRQGTFAQFVTMPEANLVTVPDNISLTTAALAEPLACGWHAVRLALAVCNGESAVVLGGGAIGVGAALSLRAQGIGDVTIIEPHPGRRASIARMEGINAAESATQVAPAPLIIDAVGIAATRADASALATPGGVISHIGLGSPEGGLDIRRMTLQEITFVGTYTYTPQDFRDTCRAIFQGQLGTLDWFETRPLSAGPQAFSDIKSGNVDAPKIILIPAPEEARH